VFPEINKELSDKNYYYAETELISLSGEIKYRIGTLYLYHPYILQLKYSYRYHNGKKHFVYDQTLEDARFNREIPIAFESIYKYWQRISDYLSSFFPEVILKLCGKTYFHHPFEYICSKHPQLMNSENLKWLVDFSKNEYPKFNRRRQFFVHQKGYDNEFFGKFLDRSGDDESVVVEMDEERDNLLVYFKKQLDHCLDGYFYLMAFLNELDIQSEKDGGFSYSLLGAPVTPI
jgi:hypothetical protein